MAINPKIIDLQLYRNADFVEEFYFTESGAAVDFTGYTGRLEIRRYGGEPLAPLAVAASTAAFEPGVNCAIGGGAVRVWIGQATIYDLPDAPVRGEPAPFSYDLRLTSPIGIDEVWLMGTAFTYPGVTQG